MPGGSGNHVSQQEEPEVTRLREYLRIKTVHPEPDYDTCVAFLRKLAKENGIPCKVVEVHPGREVVIMTYEGQEPSLPTIMLNSHTDVVPVFADEWKYDPFSAHKTAEGDIYARGIQDMKSTGMQHFEAICRLKRQGKKLKRTVHLTYVPDEEIGGQLGMNLFVKHEEFRNMNVGFALDEGLASPTDTHIVFYGERTPWWVLVRCHGNPGHGSRFIENTAAEKVRRIMNSFLDFRGREEKKLKESGCFKLGDVTTVNMTMLQGGIQFNVVPNYLDVGFDIRIPPTVDLSAFEDQIKAWCAEAGDEVTYEFIAKYVDQTLTSTDDSDLWWKAFSGACQKVEIEIEKEIFPASADIRYLREMGLPALGFSPMNNTPVLMHDHNEHLNEKVFMRGIDIYTAIVEALARA